MPRAAPEEGLEPICHQSQPLILSGYYSIIELGIEGQALIAAMVSGVQHYTPGRATALCAFPALRQQSHATKFLRIKIFSSRNQINAGSYMKAVSGGHKPMFAKHQPFK